MPRLSDMEQNAVTHALRVAAEQFDKAATDFDPLPGDGHARVAQCFRDQAITARHLAGRIEQAAAITITEARA